MNCVRQGQPHFGLRESAPAAPAPHCPPPPRCSGAEPRDQGCQRFSTLATMERTEQCWGAFGGAKPHPEGGGLFGTGLLKGLFGAHSPVLDAIHSVVDDIPIVGDIAKKVCSVVSPDYHRAAEEEKRCPPQQPQVSLALAISQSGATRPG